MNRANSCPSFPRRVLGVFACLAALTAVACDNDVNFNPTRPSVPFVPTWSNGAIAEGRNLQIAGTLTAEQGTCLAATVLFDGEELSGARTTCPQASGCATLKVAARVQSDAGRHTIAFQVLRQSPEAVRYRAEGTARVTRDGLPAITLTLPLGPTRTLLRAGESVSFDVEFWN